MPRNVYGPDHEAFRETAREFVDRSLKPRAEDFIKDKAIGREVWLEAGAQGLLGLEVPEQYGGSEARRLPAQRRARRGALEVHRRASSCFGIHTDCVAPYLVDLGTEEQKQRWLPGFCSGRAGHRDRDDRAQRRVGPRGAEDHRGARRRRLGPQRLQDLHHQRLLRRPGRGGRPHVPEKGAKGITLFGVETGMAGFERGRKLDKVGQEESDTAELFFTDVRVPDAQRIGEVDRGFIAMMERLPQERIGAAVSNTAHAQQILRRDDRLRQGAQGVRPADRRLPAQQVPHRRAADQDRGHPGVRRRLRRGARGAAADRRRRRQGQVVVGGGAERRARRVRPAARRLRLHERVPRGPRLA